MKWRTMVLATLAMTSACAMRERPLVPDMRHSKDCFGYREAQPRNRAPKGTLFSWCGEGPHITQFGQEMFAVAKLVDHLDEKQRAGFDHWTHGVFSGEGVENVGDAGKMFMLAVDTALEIHRIARIGNAQERLDEARSLTRDAYCRAARIPAPALDRLPWWRDVLAAEERELQGLGLPSEILTDGRLAVSLRGATFDEDESALDDATVEELRAVGAGLAKRRDGTVLVEGHTDRRPVIAELPDGSDDNRELGFARARAVTQVLMDAGVPEDRIRVESRAEAEPPGDGQNPRRVQIVVEPCR